MQKQKYKKLKNQERESISRGLAQKKSIREIAREIGRSPSTVSREIKRDSGKSGYRAFSASRRARAAAGSRRKVKSEVARESDLRQYVMEKLKEEWSPQEISERLKKNCY
jgi:IS30 family transposase